ncbi:MAG TPA: M23 family metallopeptidase [Pyrinomonadaceae bacterium]
MSVCSPSPGGDLRSPSFIRFTLLQRPNVVIGFVFAALCLMLSVSSVSAQTRQKRAKAKSEERARRVNNEELAEEEQSDEPDDSWRAKQNPQVRKTALTYSPRTGNQGPEQRPALTNDIVIISRAPERAAARSPLAPRVSAGAANIPSIWPVVGTLRSGVGMRNNPFGGSSVEYHKGQDISAPMGTPINVTADGVVVVAGWRKGYGNGIYVDHGNGIMTRYGHLSRIDVVVGQFVKKGDHLGLVGSTGRSTGPHLHYEVRINGEATNPLPYLSAPAPTSQVGGQ